MAGNQEEPSEMKPVLPWQRSQHSLGQERLTTEDDWQRVWVMEWETALRAEQSYPFHDALLDRARRIAHRPLHSALEIGCGGGRMMRWLASHGFDVYGFDYCWTGLQLCKTNLARHGIPGAVIAADLAAPPFGRGFDVVASFGVVEHLGQGQQLKCIEAHARLLNPRGAIIITVPNRLSLLYQAKHRVVQFVANVMPNLAHRLGANPIREIGLTAKELCCLAEDAGLSDAVVLPSSALMDCWRLSVGRFGSVRMPSLHLPIADRFFGMMIGLVATKEG
jgi:2-polyprenyl-3-methyl-5-hydroxy-6-metoxy-1,4-benzoquinol methylase